MRHPRPTTYAALLLVLALSACDRPEPVTYTIPKEQRTVEMPAPAASTPAAPSGMQVLPGMAEASASAGEFKYAVPENWEEFPASGVRKANFKVSNDNGNAEVTITSFPGDVGGTLANVNRWCGQIGAQPVTDATLPQVAEPVQISGHGGLLVHLEGSNSSILGGILGFHGFTWFFKMQGDSELVSGQQAAMKTFLESVELEDTQH
ncbi:hypothetical protein [Coraliomargarita parva]|uniref:hypothetical protein n=1 Tax=Coraliomargarita parva TaxID=3014050 RepID=UPI0022B47370|nr:hypothetical protein [Coraliomargarita parva]